eukprot:TRINITY_DN3842_c2_g1_i3.p1 TRINITY_DN3842_c2_g1~~TRINITY_DN3842_c2_g1_i3.p1  ORF type:complete len:407 (-),score=69.32 TRINITY_DN3842_c2_g1_i3:351-1571(-)
MRRTTCVVVVCFAALAVLPFVGWRVLASLPQPQCPAAPEPRTCPECRVEQQPAVVCPAPVACPAPVPCPAQEPCPECPKPGGVTMQGTVPACPACPKPPPCPSCDVASRQPQVLPMHEYAHLAAIMRSIHAAQARATTALNSVWDAWQGRPSKPQKLSNPRSRTKPVELVFMEGEMHLGVHKFGDAEKWRLKECPVPCHLSLDPQTAPQGDVLFYYLDHAPPTTYTLDWKGGDKKVIAMFTLEPAWRDHADDWLRPILFDQQHPVDMVVSFPQQSDVWVSYAAAYKNQNRTGQDIPPKKAIATFVSNCNIEYRNTFLELLQQHFTVDNFGSCGRTPGLPDTNWAKFGEQNKLVQQEQYRCLCPKLRLSHESQIRFWIRELVVERLHHGKILPLAHGTWHWPLRRCA